MATIVCWFGLFSQPHLQYTPPHTATPHEPGRWRSIVHGGAHGHRSSARHLALGGCRIGRPLCGIDEGVTDLIGSPLGGADDPTLDLEATVGEEHLVTRRVESDPARLRNTDEATRVVPRLERLLILNKARGTASGDLQRQ